MEPIQSIRYPSRPASIESQGAQTTFLGKDGLSFWDVLDVLNPLQHIPGISYLYREITGDEISPAARMAGGALYGGGIGFAGSVLMAAVEEVIGSDEVLESPAVQYANAAEKYQITAQDDYTKTILAAIERAESLSTQKIDQVDI